MVITVFLALHVFALLLWIGSLVSITRVIAAGAAESPEVQARFAALARRIYRSVASPWMGLAVLSGIGMIGAACDRMAQMHDRCGRIGLALRQHTKLIMRLGICLAEMQRHLKTIGGILVLLQLHVRNAKPAISVCIIVFVIDCRTKTIDRRCVVAGIERTLAALGGIGIGFA